MFLDEVLDLVGGLDATGQLTDDHAVGMGLVLATHAALILSETLARDRADNLARALESNREIGVAMGILMHQHRVTREQAFAICSVALDLKISNVVDVPNVVVSAFLPEVIFEG